MLGLGTFRAGQIPMEEAVKASTNMQLMRAELLMSLDLEHGTGIDHIQPHTQ
jgi:hypothetical protein